MTRIKMCGLYRREDIGYANQVRPDYTGFVFAHKGHRTVSLEKAEILRAELDPAIRSVGVYVNEDPANIEEAVRRGVIDIVQLHGGESDEYITALRKRIDVPIIQAFRIDSSEDLESVRQSIADAVLLDHGGGGTGRSFRWQLLEEVRDTISKPVFLAGGIGAENAAEAIRRIHPYALDASTALEIGKKKNYGRMKAFADAVRSADARQLEIQAEKERKHDRIQRTIREARRPVYTGNIDERSHRTGGGLQLL